MRGKELGKLLFDRIIEEAKEKIWWNCLAGA
jgi:L-amino acid N-acyltransferase YncA